MPNTTYDRYLEAEVLSADRMKLVAMLYRGAIEAVTAARRHLATGAIRERSNQIIRAWEILRELTRSIDHQQGGEISRSLAELYVYMQARLLEANTLQVDGPLGEVESLLSTLGEAWQNVKIHAAPAESEYEPVSCTC